MTPEKIDIDGRFPRILKDCARNTLFAEHQPEYLALPAVIFRGDESGMVISAWKLNWKERLILLFKGRLFLSQLTFGNPLAPMLPTVEISDFWEEAE